MRLAYVCADPGVPVFGRKGASIHVQEVVRALDARGVEVELFASRTGGDPPPGLEKVPLHGLPAPPKGDLAAREGKYASPAHSLLGHRGPGNQEQHPHRQQPRAYQNGRQAQPRHP